MNPSSAVTAAAAIMMILIITTTSAAYKLEDPGQVTQLLSGPESSFTTRG